METVTQAVDVVIDGLIKRSEKTLELASTVGEIRGYLSAMSEQFSVWQKLPAQIANLESEITSLKASLKSKNGVNIENIKGKWAFASLLIASFFTLINAVITLFWK